nr:biotin/lipoyl-containing protein [Haliscomenobacter sp.]
MAEVIRMPRMSDTMEEGNIIGWLKKEGDRVEPGQTLAEVETDKATMELDAFVEGVILHIAVKEGPVAIDGVIAVIGQPGEDWQAVLAAANGSSAAAPTANGQSTPAVAPAAEVPAAAAVGEDSRIKASPLAKNIAKESGVSLEQVVGSGDQGRIVKKDVEAFLEGKGATAVVTPTPAVTPQPSPSPTPAAKAESQLAYLLPSMLAVVILKK